MIDRAFTKAEARYIPNGAGLDRRHGPSDPDGRPRGVRLPAVPVRRRDARARSIAPSHFFGQHGYVPDVQDLAANVNMRATFLAGGQAHRARAASTRATIDLAPTLAYLLRHPRAAAQPGHRPAAGVLNGRRPLKP